MSSFKLLQPQPCDTQHRSLRAGGLADLARFPPQRDRGGGCGITLQRLHSPSARDGLLELRAHESLEEWFDRADAALYAVKNSGRNAARLSA